MISAIVYSSSTGSSEKYAKLLSAALHVPAMPAGKCPVRKDGNVIYVGWTMAGKVVGYEKAAKKLNIAAVVQVGMSPVTDKLKAEVREKNNIPADVAVFAKQGAFSMSSIALPYRPVMMLINKKIVKGLSNKTDRTSEEEAVYQMALNGEGQPASWDVSDILAWAKDGWFTSEGRML